MIVKDVSDEVSDYSYDDSTGYAMKLWADRSISCSFKSCLNVNGVKFGK